jgi:hypothetical protein
MSSKDGDIAKKPLLTNETEEETKTITSNTRNETITHPKKETLPLIDHPKHQHEFKLFTYDQLPDYLKDNGNHFSSFACHLFLTFFPPMSKKFCENFFRYF